MSITIGILIFVAILAVGFCVLECLLSIQRYLLKINMQLGLIIAEAQLQFPNFRDSMERVGAKVDGTFVKGGPKL